jgi:hypothetical protein
VLLDRKGSPLGPSRTLTLALNRRGSIEKRDPDLCLGRVGAPCRFALVPPGIAVR